MAPTERDLVEQVVAGDLLGEGALFEGDEPPAPRGYALKELIGRGGCGEVYLARDLTLERPVAIKYLTDARPADVERFRREARFAARLNNPAIVQVFELGEVDSQPYIVMQYAGGGNLADASLDAAGVVRVIRAVAAALRHAHAEGIVHRDIKPENILLDREGNALLSDFGIARSLDGRLGHTISQDGQIIGTPGLMSPEQARGDIQAIDGRSDIYALGATLFLKLTGRYPFEGPSIVDVLHAVMHDPPPLLRAFNASAPRGLEGIVHRCLKKAREERYQSAAEVIADLDGFLEGAMEGRGSAWFRHLVGSVPGAPPRGPEGADLESDAFFSEGMEIVRALAQWDADRYRVSGSLARSFERLDGIAERLRGILHQRPDTAWARFYLGSVLHRRGELGAAVEAMERSIDRVRDQAGASFELGRLYLSMYLHEQREARRHLSCTGVAHDLHEARARLDQALLALREAQHLSGDLPHWHEPYVGAVTHLAEGDFPGCIAACEQILAEDPDVEEAWKLRGDAQQLAGLEPFESYDRALEVRRSYFEALLAKAEAQMARAQHAGAAESLGRALEIHPGFTDALALLARALLGEGRHRSDDGPLEEALRTARRAIALDPRNHDAHVVLAEIELERGRRLGSEACLDQALVALDAARHLPGCENRVDLLTAGVLIERARVAGEARQPGTRRELERLAAMCRERIPRHPDNQPWREVLGQVEDELRRLDRPA